MLSELLSRLDLSEVPVDTLAAAIKEARNQQGDLRDFIGKAAAALNRDGLTFSRIAELTGIPHSSLHLWAKPHL